MSSSLEEMAERLRSMAEELQTAARHCRVAGDHFINGEVPRGCAHTFSAEGHMINARKILDECARTQAIKAQFGDGND